MIRKKRQYNRHSEVSSFVGNPVCAFYRCLLDLNLTKFCKFPYTFTLVYYTIVVAYINTMKMTFDYNFYLNQAGYT